MMVLGTFSVIAIVLARDDLQLLVALVSLGSVIIIRVYLWRYRQRHPEEKLDMRRLLQTRVRVSLQHRNGEPGLAPRSLTGTIISVGEKGRSSEIIVRLDSSLWVSQARWDFIALLPLNDRLRIAYLLRDPEMDVHVLLVTQRHLDQLRGKLTAFLRLKNLPLVSLARGRVVLLGPNG
jgi:hypothetical protein